MLNTLITAIARLLGGKTQPMEVSVQLTQTAGHAPQEPTTKRGNKRSAQPTKRQPVKAKSKRKPSVVQPTKQVASRKKTQKSVRKNRCAYG